VGESIFQKEYIRRNFGLLSKDTCIKVCLRFSLQIVPWVSEQIWHSEQKQAIQSDGSLCLEFTVADLKEVKREVLMPPRYLKNLLARSQWSIFRKSAVRALPQMSDLGL